MKTAVSAKRAPSNPSGRWLISDELWSELQPLLPSFPKPELSKGGRPRVPERKAMNGIFFVLRTGCQWNALNATGICSSSTAHLRFQQWVEAGVFHQLWAKGLNRYDEVRGIQWRWQSMDATMTKAPLGGEKNGSQSHRPRQKRRKTQPAV
jgi:transposase